MTIFTHKARRRTKANTLRFVFSVMRSRLSATKKTPTCEVVVEQRKLREMSQLPDFRRDRSCARNSHAYMWADVLLHIIQAREVAAAHADAARCAWHSWTWPDSLTLTYEPFRRLEPRTIRVSRCSRPTSVGIRPGQHTRQATRTRIYIITY